jgi:hypothetical protein
MSPQQPSWKQEARQEAAPQEAAHETTQEPETKPAVEQKPDGPGENQ